MVPTVSWEEVPSVKELQKCLGVGRTAGLGQALIPRLQTFRQDFVSSDRIPCCQLTKWGSQEHQLGVAEATKEFLEQYRQQLWPDNETARYYNDGLRYKRDYYT